MRSTLHQPVGANRFVVTFCLFLIAFRVCAADEIAWNNPNTIETNDSILVRIAAPNSVGVSFNRLPEVKQGRKGIEIVNAATLNNALAGREADVIVLAIADPSRVIELDADVSLVGKQADIILLASPGGAVNCNNCRFNAMPRLSIATGNLNIDLDGYPKSIDVGAGTIRISGAGMQAKDTLAMDLLSDNIEIDATINTQLKGKFYGNEVKIDAQGDLKLASGALNIIQGQFRQNYSTGIISDINLAGNGLLNVGKNSLLSAGDIHLESATRSAKTRIAGNLTVQSDRTLVSVHRGKNIVPQKRVRIRTLGDLEILADINAASIDIETARNLHLNDEPSILAQKVEFLAGLDVVNQGVINADHFQMVADRISNQGEIWIEESAFLGADRVFNNHLGGMLVARELTVSSHGIVTNGSRRAYHLDDDFYDLTASEQAFGDLPEEFGIQSDGTVIADGQPARYRLAPDLAAVIVGQNIDIRARLLRNINPYSTSNFSNDADLVLDVEKSRQVLLSASGRLIVETEEAIENVSAIIEGGESLHFDSKIVSNNRFQIVTDTRPIDNFRRDACINLRSCYLSSPNISLVIGGMEEFFKYISPAGRIIGNSEATAIRDSTIRAEVFENKNSFFEVVGNLNVAVGEVKIEGTTLEQDLQAVQTTHHRKRYCKRRIAGFCVSRRTKHWETHKTFTATDDGDSLPSILLVGETLQGQGAELFVLAN